MRLIDADVLKADYGMADDCKTAKQDGDPVSVTILIPR